MYCDLCMVLSLAIEKTQKYKVSQKFFSFLKYFWDIMYFPWEILPVPTHITPFHVYFTDTGFCRSDCYGNVNGVHICIVSIYQLMFYMMTQHILYLLQPHPSCFLL